MKSKLLLLSVFLLVSSLAAFARQPQRGFRTFAEWTNDVKADIAIYGGPTDSRYHTGVALSHGYQFNPWLFAGGGIMVEQCVKDNKIYSAPLFAHLRSDLCFRRFTPFVDVRAGYNFANYGGVFFSPTIGYRINWGRRVGVNIGIGWSMTGNREEIRETTTIVGPGNSGTNTTYSRAHQYDDTFTFRVGVDF